MPVKLTKTNINPNNRNYHPLLEDLQGNILKSHGRDHSVHLFLRFVAGSDDARGWIREFAKKHVTSAKQQYDEAKRYKIEKNLAPCKLCLCHNIPIMGAWWVADYFWPATSK